MKRILPLIIISLLFSINLVNAQCSPDPNCTDPEGDGEFCPTEFPSAIEDEYYEQVLTIISPSEQSGFVIDHIEIVSISNIPPGMNYQCQDNNCAFYPQTPKCVNVFGIPEVDSWGDYKLYITIEAFINVSGIVFSAGEIVDSSSVVTVLPQVYGDFTVNLENDNVMCYEQAYEVNYTGNATSDAIYNWDFGNNLEVISGDGQGPYMVQPNNGFGLDSITLFVEEGVYTSPVFAESFIINTCMGVDNQSLSQFSIYPNPFVEGVTCFGLDNVLSEVNVFTLSGTKVYSQMISTNQNYINLLELKNGIYILSLTNSKKTQTIKIVKQ